MASKILSINISGMVFPMTEEAYEALQSYLGSIKKCFASHQDREEIIADLESRMAEHFSEKVSSKHQVLLKKDVEALILIMGRAEDFELEKDQWEEGSLESSFLYRDGEGAIIAGVCAGLGHYLKIDPLLIRLTFFLSLFVGGLGLLIYLLLWILIPEAKTAFQKQQMHKGRFDLKKELKKIGKRIHQSIA